MSNQTNEAAQERIRVIRNTDAYRCECVAEVNGLEAAYAIVRLFCGRNEPRSDFWFRVVTP